MSSPGVAVRRPTFDSATAFGIYDRGLLQPGTAADLVIFDPDTGNHPGRTVHNARDQMSR